MALLVIILYKFAWRQEERIRIASGTRLSYRLDSYVDKLFIVIFTAANKEKECLYIVDPLRNY